MKIEKNDMVMVYDGGGTVPHCKYTGRFGDLTAYWQEIVTDAVYLFRLGGERGVRLVGSSRPALVTVFTGRHSLKGKRRGIARGVPPFRRGAEGRRNWIDMRL